MLGKKSEILKRYIAVMSVLRGYPRVAAIVLLVQYQRQYILYSMKYQVLSDRVRQKRCGQKSVFLIYRFGAQYC